MNCTSHPPPRPAAPAPQGLVIDTCPHGSASDNTTVVSAVFNQDWSLYSDIP